MDLSEYVASVAPETGRGSIMEIPAAGETTEIYADRDRAESMIATSLWHFLLSQGQLVHRFHSPFRALSYVSELVIVPGGSVESTRYDLLVRGGYAGTVLPRAELLGPDHLYELLGVWGGDSIFRYWRDSWLDEAELQMQSEKDSVRSSFWPQTHQFIASLSPTVFFDALETERFAVITAPAQQYELTKSTVPDPAVDVRSPKNSALLGTAGVIADRNGTRGITVAAHVLHDGTNWPSPGATVCLVGGQKGNVITCDPVSDSCFIELDQPIPFSGTPIPVGPLSGVSPRKGEVVTSHGAVSGRVTGKVEGWDPLLPMFNQFAQTKLHTTPMTNPGDSGAALLDAQCHVLGFAFMRSPFGATTQESLWIWADSVYHAHQLS